MVESVRLVFTSTKKTGEETAVIAMGKLLRMMYDWEGLQTALVDTKLLREREAEIYAMPGTSHVRQRRARRRAAAAGLSG